MPLTAPDTEARALIAIFTRAHEAIRLQVQTAVERQTLGTEAQRRQQLAKVEATLAKLQREMAPLIEPACSRPYAAAANAVDFLGGLTPDHFEFAGVHLDAVRIAVAALDRRLSDGIVQVGRTTDDIFRRVQLEQAAVGTAAGETRKQTTDRMVLDLRAHGISCFVDRAGRRWSLERYCAMTVRTNARELASAATHNRMLDAGDDIIEISKHKHDRDICDEFEGNRYSLSGRDTRYPRVKRLPPFHPQCVHVAFPAAVTFDDFEAELARPQPTPPPKPPKRKTGTVDDAVKRLPAIIDRYLADRGDLAAKPADASIQHGRPFQRDERVFVQVEGRSGALRGEDGDPSGLMPYMRDKGIDLGDASKGDIQEALKRLGFARAPVSYKHADRGNAQTSYYSAPAAVLKTKPDVAPPDVEPVPVDVPLLPEKAPPRRDMTDEESSIAAIRALVFDARGDRKIDRRDEVTLRAVGAAIRAHQERFPAKPSDGDPRTLAVIMAEKDRASQELDAIIAMRRSAPTFDERVALRDQQIIAHRVVMKLSQELAAKRVQAGAGDTDGLRAVIAAVRPGFGTARISPPRSRSAGWKRLDEACRNFPAEWVEECRANLKVRMSQGYTSRGYYQHDYYGGDGGTIVIRDDPANATHELGHRLQFRAHGKHANPTGIAHAMLRVDAAAVAFHKRRTKGQARRKLSQIFRNSGYNAREVAREDEYRSAYTGKEYGVDVDEYGDPLEVLTMGLEGVWHGRDQLKERDPEHWDLIVGMLAGV